MNRMLIQQNRDLYLDSEKVQTAQPEAKLAANKMQCENCKGTGYMFRTTPRQSLGINITESKFNAMKNNLEAPGGMSRGNTGKSF